MTDWSLFPYVEKKRTGRVILTTLLYSLNYQRTTRNSSSFNVIRTRRLRGLMTLKEEVWSFLLMAVEGFLSSGKTYVLRDSSELV